MKIVVMIVFQNMKFQINLDQLIYYIIIRKMSKTIQESYSLNESESSNSQIFENSSRIGRKKPIKKNFRKKQYAIVHHICIHCLDANGQPFFMHFSEYKEMQTKSKNIRGVAMYGAQKFSNRKKHQLTSCIKKEQDEQSQTDQKHVFKRKLTEQIQPVKVQPLYS